MEYLSSYVKTIAIFLIFSSFVELILPSSHFKKYIDIVLGLIMVIILIKPINNLIVNAQKPIDEFIIENQNQLNKEILSLETIRYENEQQQLIINNYKEQIILQITQLLEQRFDLKPESVDIEIVSDINSSDFGIIKAITIKSYNLSVDHNDEKNIVKKTLGDFYNMSPDNIYIK